MATRKTIYRLQISAAPHPHPHQMTFLSRPTPYAVAEGLRLEIRDQEAEAAACEEEGDGLDTDLACHTLDKLRHFLEVVEHVTDIPKGSNSICPVVVAGVKVGQVAVTSESAYL